MLGCLDQVVSRLGDVSTEQKGGLSMTERLRAVSRAEVRQLDVQAARELAMPTSLLMENAGRGAAGWLAELVGAIPPGAGGRPFSLPLSARSALCKAALPRVLVLCGPGNNGGDGGVVARHLNAWGFPVRVIWFSHSDQLCGDAALQWAILNKSGIDQSAWFDEYSSDSRHDLTRLAMTIDAADWLVDGLLGTGLSRPVDGLLYSVIDTMNRSGKPIFALDVPSGLDSDSGKPLGMAVRAMATATFVAVKLGFSTPGAAKYTGEVAVIDIGLPRCLLEPLRET
jgi:NAD(P)H-hydrate epimerase